MRKITFEEFVSRAKEIHGDKYVYAKQNFVDMRTKMVVHCTKHGQFSVIPYDLLQGHGCRKCDIDKKRYLLYGVALNDVYGAKKTKAYKRWYNILIRCYDEKIKAKRPTYAECLMCEEWLTFSNFKKWFDEHYVENYQIDKDILVKGNKLYSPETCCFVPNKINTLLINRTNDRGNESIGVAKSKYGRYESYVSINGKRTHLGTFDTELQAFQKYKQVKEDYIKGVAKIYYQEGKINLRVYEALMRYEVNIDD